jgi:hypothetical protein
VPKLLVKTDMPQSWKICAILLSFDCYSCNTNSCSFSTLSLSNLVRLSSAVAVILPSGSIINSIFLSFASGALEPYCLFQLLPAAASAALLNCYAKANTSSVKVTVISREFSFNLR